MVDPIPLARLRELTQSTPDRVGGTHVDTAFLRDLAGELLALREPEAPSPVATERARWAEAMTDVADGLTRRDQACQRLASTHADDDTAAHERLTAKAQGYAHAAELLRAAIADAKGTP